MTSLSPTTGPVAGGTSVTITGSNFTGASAVTFGTSSATAFTVDSDSQITVTSPNNSAGQVAVSVTTAGGTSATGMATRFTYIARPVVSSLSPASGPVAGGTTVTITGSKFTGASAVTFGTSATTSFTVDSDTQITVTSPNNSAGQVAVSVTTAGGTSATGMATRFTYIARPVVSSVSPATGPVAGGTSVTIIGSHFTDASAVTFGTSAATGFTVDSDTQISATAPGNSAGQVAVSVTTTGGTSATGMATRFTYIARPVVSSVSPATGPVAGGTLVTIIGSHFTDASAVTFGTSAATGFTVDSDTQISASAPGNSAGQVAVSVTTTGGRSDTGVSTRFTYIARPVVSSVSPATGPVAGGTSVTVTGSHFTGASAVAFDSVAAASFTVDSDTQITAVTPAKSADVTHITVTTVGGSSNTSAADKFTFENPPGTVTIRQVVTGGDGAFAFTSSTSDLNLSITTVGGTGTSAAIALPAGSYSVEAAIIAGGAFGLTDISCDDNDSTGNPTERKASIELAAGEAVVCTFTSVETRDKTAAIVRAFFGARAGAILGHLPGEQRRIDRLAGIATPPGNPLPTLMQYLPALADGKVPTTTISASLAAMEALTGKSTGGLDVWAQATLGKFNDDGLSGNFGMLSAGADYVLNRNLLLGGFVQVDDIPGAGATTGGTVGGVGWLAGPYLTARLADRVFLDLLAAAGRSDDHVSPLGTYTDQFGSARWMISAALSGQWTAGNWSIEPTARFSYFQETSDGYTDGLGVDIPSMTSGSGQIGVGPRISYRFQPFDGVVADASVKFDAVFDIRSGATSAGVSDTAFRGRFEGGIDLRSTSGAGVGASAAFDGIGSRSISSISGSVHFSVPLN